MGLTSVYLFISLTFLNSFVHGAMLYEPSFGFKVLGDNKHQEQTYKTSYTDFGFKGGYEAYRTYAGIDTSFIFWNLDSADDRTSERFKGPALGLFIGKQYSMFRFYFSYLPIAKMHSSFDSSKISGSGFSFQTSLVLYKFLNVFLKYQTISYKSREVSSGAETDLNSIPISSKLLIFGFSFPLKIN